MVRQIKEVDTTLYSKVQENAVVHSFETHYRIFQKYSFGISNSVEESEKLREEYMESLMQIETILEKKGDGFIKVEEYSL